MPLTLWRLFDHNAPWAKLSSFDPLDGSGGLYTPSRWNHRGTPVVYTSASPSLAVLETLVHVGTELFGERKLLRLEVETASIEAVAKARLIQMLRDAADPDREECTRAFGSQWIKEVRSLLLQVPSVVVPHEHNYVLNPRHPEMAKLSVVEEDFVRLDSRLLG